MVLAILIVLMLAVAGYAYLLHRNSPSNPASDVWVAPETSFFEWKERNGIH